MKKAIVILDDNKISKALLIDSIKRQNINYHFQRLEVLIFDKGSKNILNENIEFCKSLKMNYKTVDISKLNNLYMNKEFSFINYITLSLNYAINSKASYIITSVFNPNGIMSKKMLNLRQTIKVLTDGKVNLLSPYCELNKVKINKKLSRVDF